ncbi:MAG: PspC domain-containing protein [Candidatus Spechtbacterales bacterium]
MAGGLGEYLKTDSTILRLIMAVAVVFTGVFPGVILYLIAWIVVPEEGETEKK